MLPTQFNLVRKVLSALGLLKSKIENRKSKILIFSLLLLTSCSSTHIQSTLTPPAGAVAPFRNVMVVGADERPAVRRQFENNVVAFLQRRNVKGVASQSQFQLDELKGEREQIRQKLAAAGAESVLVVKLTDRGTFVSGPPPSLGSWSWGGVDEARYVNFTSGGEIKTTARLGARLFRVSDGSLVWSALVETVLGEDYDSIAVLQTTAKDIVAKMAKDKVIP